MAILQGTGFNCIYWEASGGRFRLCSEYDEYVISHTDLMSILRSCAYKEVDIQNGSAPYIEPILLHPMITAGNNIDDENAYCDDMDEQEPEYNEDREEMMPSEPTWTIMPREER